MILKTHNCFVFYVTLENVSRHTPLLKISSLKQNWFLRSARHVTALLHLRSQSGKNFYVPAQFEIRSSGSQNLLPLRDATAVLFQGLSQLSQ